MIEISSLFLLKGYFFMENVHLFIYEKIPAGSFSAGVWRFSRVSLLNARRLYRYNVTRNCCPFYLKFIRPWFRKSM